MSDAEENTYFTVVSRSSGSQSGPGVLEFSTFETNRTALGEIWIKANVDQHVSLMSAYLSNMLIMNCTLLIVIILLIGCLLVDHLCKPRLEELLSKGLRLSTGDWSPLSAGRRGGLPTGLWDQNDLTSREGGPSACWLLPGRFRMPCTMGGMEPLWDGVFFRQQYRPQRKTSSVKSAGE